MWNGCRITNCDYSDSGVGNRPDCRFAAATRSFNSNLALLHSCFVGLFRGFIGGLLGCKRCPLARAAESARTGLGLGNQITLQVGNRDHRVIERGSHMGDALRDMLLLFLSKNFLLAGSLCHVFVGGPLLVVSGP